MVGGLSFREEHGNHLRDDVIQISCATSLTCPPEPVQHPHLSANLVLFCFASYLVQCSHFSANLPLFSSVLQCAMFSCSVQVDTLCNILTLMQILLALFCLSVSLCNILTALSILPGQHSYCSASFFAKKNSVREPASFHDTDRNQAQKINRCFAISLQLNEGDFLISSWTRENFV